MKINKRELDRLLNPSDNEELKQANKNVAKEETIQGIADGWLFAIMTDNWFGDD